MTFRKCLFVLALFPLILAAPLAAQNVQLRGLPQPGSTLLPSAQQQLNQNLDRQKTEFSTQRQIDRVVRQNHIDDINRLNAERNIYSNPCAHGGSACNPK